jgi:hypothetical protein
MIYAVVLPLTAAYALLMTCTRFRLPLDPYLVIFAAVALVKVAERVSHKLPAERVVRAPQTPSSKYLPPLGGT